jgi:hypothetical protein
VAAGKVFVVSAEMSFTTSDVVEVVLALPIALQQISIIA